MMRVEYGTAENVDTALLKGEHDGTKRKDV